MPAAERPIQQLLDLTGQVALVTGGSGWLGAAFSRALAEAGARVIVTSRTADKAAAFAATLPGTGHLGRALDLDDTDSLPAFITEVVAAAGQLDILVNNAYGAPRALLETATAADFDQAYHVGVSAGFILARAVYDHLRQRSAPGSIINIASMYGLVGSYPSAYAGFDMNSPPPYHALKGALLQLTRHLAVYWAPAGVRVNCISPGPFPSAATQQNLPDFVKRLETHVPLGRIGAPEELKGVVVLLASEAGRYITGQNFVVDGGWTAW
jgi:gluconate 5-dehydrogenase